MFKLCLTDVLINSYRCLFKNTKTFYSYIAYIEKRFSNHALGRLPRALGIKFIDLLFSF